MVLSICQMDPDHDTAHVRAMFWEYLQWANSRLNEEFGIDFGIEAMVDKTMRELQTYSPPDGRLLLARDGSEVAAIACMRRIDDDIGEIKRMYVRGSFRGQGIGRALLERLLDEARQVGYIRIRLDSARFMEEAHSLYRSAGFREIQPYAGSEIPAEFHEHWVFMEKDIP
jgi:GNAT superfamily N-acetyltransferase